MRPVFMNIERGTYLRFHTDAGISAAEPTSRAETDPRETAQLLLPTSAASR